MNSSLENKILDKVKEIKSATKENSFDKNILEVGMFESIFKLSKMDSDISDQVLELERIVNENTLEIKSRIVSSAKFLSRLASRSSKESKFSKLFIPELLDSEDPVVVKDGKIFGHSKNSKIENKIELKKEEVKINFVGDGEIRPGTVVNRGELTAFMQENFEINPSKRNTSESTLIIEISLDRIESIKELFLDMNKSRVVKIFYKRSNNKEFEFLTETRGSIIKQSLNIEVTDIKILIGMKFYDTTNGGIEINTLSLGRYNHSEDATIDIDIETKENLEFIEVIRCDSENNNIEYLVSASGRPFKNATKEPVRAYGVEDGEIYQLFATEAYRSNGKENRVFLLGLDNAIINSNEWSVFTGKFEWKEEMIGDMDFWSGVVIYRDIFTIEVPAGKTIYMNGNPVAGSSIVYPGVYKILIPKSIPKLYSRKFYDKIVYENNSIILTRQDGNQDTISSAVDIFAQIDTTAAYMFSERHMDFRMENEGRIILETEEQVLFVGFSPNKPLLEDIRLRVKFSKSNKIAEISHVALKLFWFLRLDKEWF